MMKGSPLPNNSKNIQDSLITDKIELLIQQKYNITIPSLYFEYLSSENVDFEVNDLKTFYSYFGDIIDLVKKGKLSIVLYKTFYSADCCREFLLNQNNYKEEGMKQNFLVRWFDFEKDRHNLPSDMENKFESIHNRNLCNIKESKDKILSMIKNNKNRMNNSTNNNINQNKNQNPININGNSNQNSNNMFMQKNMMMQYNQMNMNQGISLNNINNIPQNIQNMHSIQNFGGIQNMMMSSPMNMPLFMKCN